MHQPKPWFRAARNRWYVQLAGKQIPLVDGEENEEAAWAEYHRLMASQGRMEVREDISFLSLAELFLEHSERRNKPATFKWYKHYINWFCTVYTGPAADVKPTHVNGWLADEPYGTRRGGINVVKRVLTWAHREGHLKLNPLAGLPNLKPKRREGLVTKDQHEAILGKADVAFRFFVAALMETGARPGEIRRVEARHFLKDRGLLVLPPEDAVKPTDRPKVIYLTPKMVRICSRLARTNPEGTLFRNSRGKPWTKNAINSRVCRLRKAGILPKGVPMYAYRHAFATSALSNGVSLAELRELMGHSDLRMLAQHYGHLDGNADRLREAARKAVG